MSKKAPSVATIPFLAEQWDYAKNEIDIESISSVAQIPVHWICKKCGYSWLASPRARLRGSEGRCPCCEAGVAIKKGVNDLFTVVPELIDSYDFEKNGDFDIFSVGVSSPKQVFWKCSICGRSWKASIQGRIKRVDGHYEVKSCPHRNTTKRRPDDVPFVSSLPNLMRFWDHEENSLDPNAVRENSPLRVKWRCRICGHTWEVPIFAQAKASGKCACCEQNQVKKANVTDAFTLVPKLKESYDFSKNLGIDIGSLGVRNNTVLIDWKCPDCSFEWRSTIAARIRGSLGNYTVSGCRQCYHKSKHRLSPVSSFPKLMKFWDFSKNESMDPNLTSANSYASAHWLCKECGYAWVSTIHSRKNSSGKCPCCESGRRVVSGYNDVVSIVPEILSIFDAQVNKNVNLSAYALFSKKIVSWKCPHCGNCWKSSISDRIHKNKDGTYRLVGCPVCQNMGRRQQTYADQYPQLAAMFNENLNNRTLASVSSNESNTVKFWWDCPSCGTTFPSRLQTMIVAKDTRSRGCPSCAKTVQKGQSFADLHPNIMVEYDPANQLDPFVVFPTSKEVVSWICSAFPQHKWTASFLLRHTGGGRCPICHRTRVVEDINSFAAVYPEQAMLWSPSNPQKPSEVFHDATQRFKWICPVCSGEYSATIDEIVNNPSVCPYCSNRQILPGFNSFKELHKDLIDNWDFISNYLLADPDKIGESCAIPVWWNCPHDQTHHYLMSPKQRLLFQKRQQEPCLYCKGRRRKKHHFI